MNQLAKISSEGATRLLAISADSHVVEPPELWPAYVDPAFRDRVPRIERNAERGDIYVVDGIDMPIPLTILGNAGLDMTRLKASELHWREDLRSGGWDPKARIQSQDQDGLIGEMIYPSLAMLLCSHGDLDYRHAMLWAYNRWLADFTGAAPDRLFGLGLPAIRSVPEAIEEVTKLREMGFRGVMLPGDPGTEEDYDQPVFDPLWQRLADLNMPISFHVLTAGRRDKSGSFGSQPTRGPRINVAHAVIRSIQDIAGMFLWGGVFERHPKLKLVCAEADAGWAPHFMYRLDRFYRHHRWQLKVEEMSRMPSEIFKDQVYMTFQDDRTAFDQIDHMNAERLLWASDFPHSDSTFPHSQALLADQTAGLTDTQRQRILHDNVAELYDLPVARG